MHAILQVQGEEYGFDVVVKRHLHAATAARLASDLGETRERTLVVTEHVQPAVAAVLREQGVSYADAAGNCHMRRPPLFLHVEGRPRAWSPSREAVRAFKGEGLKVIFALLLEPRWAERPYRDLAQLTGASHGVVQYTISDLDRLDFLVRLGRTERHLQNLPGLLDRWAEAYATVLRPKLSLGHFTATEAGLLSDWRDRDLEAQQERWGGEPAAALATGYLKPARVTVYVRSSRSGFMQRWRMVPDEDGVLEAMRAFWPERLEEELPSLFSEHVVPDVLVYADLLATGDPRNAEAAALLHERLEAGWGHG